MPSDLDPERAACGHRRGRIDDRAVALGESHALDREQDLGRADDPQPRRERPADAKASTGGEPATGARLGEREVRAGAVHGADLRAQPRAQWFVLGPPAEAHGRDAEPDVDVRGLVAIRAGGEPLGGRDLAHQRVVARTDRDLGADADLGDDTDAADAGEPNIERPRVRRLPAEIAMNEHGLDERLGREDPRRCDVDRGVIFSEPRHDDRDGIGELGAGARGQRADIRGELDLGAEASGLAANRDLRGRGEHRIEGVAEPLLDPRLDARRARAGVRRVQAKLCMSGRAEHGHQDQCAHGAPTPAAITRCNAMHASR